VTGPGPDHPGDSPAPTPPPAPPARDGRPPAVVLAVLVVLALLTVGMVLGRLGAEAELAHLFGEHVPEGLAQGTFAALLVGLGVFLFAHRRRGQLGAVAGTSFKEIRRGGALWVAALAGAAVACGAPLLEAEGGPAGRVKMILSVTLGAASLVGTLLAVGLPALSFSREMETRSIYVVTTKPVPRWVIYSGKLLGVGLALGLTVAALGLGALVAANLALAEESRRARREGRDPEHVWLTAYHSRLDTRPPLVPRPDGRLPRGETFYRGGRRHYTLDVSRAEMRRKWLVLRLYAGPANPRIQSAPARVYCGGKTYEVNLDRSIPYDLVVPASAVRGGKLTVGLEPTRDVEGINRGLYLPPRGPVALAREGNGLVMTLAKSLGLVWLQLLVIAAVTTTAAAVLSFPVAAVTGAAAALTGQLSGLAVGILRGALKIGQTAAEQGGPGSPGAVEEASVLGQMVRQTVAGLLSVLPDFEAASASGFLAAGDFVPWRFIVAGVISLAVLRALPVAALGCLVFSRREVGA